MEGRGMDDHKTLTKMMREAMREAAQKVVDDFVERHNFDQVIMGFLAEEKKSILEQARSEALSRVKQKVSGSVSDAERDFVRTTDHEVRLLIREKIAETNLEARAQTMVYSAIDAMNRAAKQAK